MAKKKKAEHYKHSIEKVDSLVGYVNNSRTHSPEQITQIVSSIREFGFTNPILIDEKKNVIAGHGRIQAALKLKIDEIPCITLNGLTEAQRKAYVIADNQLALNAGWDLDLLKIEIEGLSELDFSLDLLGFDGDFLTGLLEPEPSEGLTDEDAIPEVPEKPTTVLGDVWILGSHRLMCGDSTSIDAVEKLMNGQKADITFCSPPYNVGGTSSPNGTREKYANNTDDKSTKDYKDLLNGFVTIALTISDYVFSNIQSLAGNKIALIEHLYDMRSYFADTLIWNKKTAEPAMARKVLNSQFEYVHVFSNESKRSIGARDFRGTLTNIIEINSRQDKGLSKVHKATFPIEFASHFITNFTESSCFDPFGGTGTTLISCQKNNRNCFTMELDPKYCDVIIKRWEEYTGEKAVLEEGSE